MNKKELAVLEAAFSQEISAAMNHTSSLYQSNSATARKLCEEGLLAERVEVLGGRIPVKVTGYVLTHAGRLAYCMSCEDESAEIGRAMREVPNADAR